MSTLYLDRKGLELRADGNAMALYESGERIRTVPLSLLDRVVIRAEALIRLTSEPPLPNGLLALGQRGPQCFETPHGHELLQFLGRVLTRCLSRWLIP